ncbi:hypothetical protein NPIL_596771 [Nephila pilipes]|uniref:Uncharacterized protein n=1 Tax=Nephila pilipes TaxID=299642 RepID=A0A8X6PWY7_NEPPI|nr:hypothetical protein NPIL_596771 [Nephila pilipes]
MTANIDLVRIYHPRQRDEGVVETDGLHGEGSRAEQVESEYSKGLARESSIKEGQWRGRRVRSKGSTESSNNKERLHQSKRREAADESGVLSRRSSPPRGATDNHRQVLPGRSSPYQLRNRRHIKEGQEESRKSSPYPLRNRLSISERQAATGRTSPYHTRAGGVETMRSRSRFRPYK